MIRRGERGMKFSEWRASRNEQARARLLRKIPAGFPKQVLLHALARPFIPPTLRRAVDSYWHNHPVRADRLARALALRSGAPPGWRWKADKTRSDQREVCRVPPAPFREDPFALGPGHCSVCGQPVYRFGWHRDFWGDGRPNRTATWHGCCIAAWKLWTSPREYVRHLKKLQKHRCGITGARLLRSAEVDHRVPLFRVSRQRDQTWPALLAYWGVPNLQVINRSAHVQKCSRESAERADFRLRALSPEP
jgi:hypothetical protein